MKLKLLRCCICWRPWPCQTERCFFLWGNRRGIPHSVLFSWRAHSCNVLVHVLHNGMMCLLALAVLVLFSYVRYFSSLNMSAIPITKSRSEYVLLRVLYNGTCWTHRFRGNVLLVAFFLSYWMWNLTSWARLRTGLLQAWYHGRERSTADTDLHFEEHRQGKNQWRGAE